MCSQNWNVKYSQWKFQTFLSFPNPNQTQRLTSKEATASLLLGLSWFFWLFVLRTYHLKRNGSKENFGIPAIQCRNCQSFLRESKSKSPRSCYPPEFCKAVLHSNNPIQTTLFLLLLAALVSSACDPFLYDTQEKVSTGLGLTFPIINGIWGVSWRKITTMLLRIMGTFFHGWVQRNGEMSSNCATSSFEINVDCDAKFMSNSLVGW